MLCGLTLLCYYLHCVSNQVWLRNCKWACLLVYFAKTSRTCVYVLQEINTQVSKHIYNIHKGVCRGVTGWMLYNRAFLGLCVCVAI